MGLSSNTLIHLTTKKEALFGILKEGFKVKYCYEELRTKKGRVTAAFPMISLSDIPLSSLSYHIESYGNYGIGLKKQWAKKIGLNPVLYFDDNSIIGGRIREDFYKTSQKFAEGTVDEEIHQTNLSILSYSKNYEGTLITAKIKRENYRFSDEREWRYVPSPEELKDASPYIVKPQYSTEEQKNNANKTLEHIRITFDPDDINYIFLEDEKEIPQFIQIIREANSSKTFHSVERLLTRIMTTDQIKTDF
jgi:hypothetical protein